MVQGTGNLLGAISGVYKARPKVLGRQRTEDSAEEQKRQRRLICALGHRSDGSSGELSDVVK